MASKQDKKEEISVRLASEFEITYPKSSFLNDKEEKRIQKAVTEGGIAIGTKTYMDSEKLPCLLNTDIKGVQLALNDAPDKDLKSYGDKDYLSTPQVQKEIAKRREQPYSKLDREKLKYAGECVERFSNNIQLDNERTIESERINKERPKLCKKVIKERNSTISELSGKPLENTARVHHKNRVADKPEEALNRDNLAVIRDDEHKEFHSSDYLQNEEGYEKFKKDNYPSLK